MRLTQTLFKWRPEFTGYKPKYPGHVYVGKHRYTPPVTSMAKYFVMRQLLYEEENMKYLSRPYITEVFTLLYCHSIVVLIPIHFRNKNRPTCSPLEGHIQNTTTSLCIKR